MEFTRWLRNLLPQPSRDLSVKETHHKPYVSNLCSGKQYPVISENLFSVDFNPVSAGVMFENPDGISVGYGFVSFITREEPEAEAAISSLNGKELLGRPVTLKFSERTTEV